MAVRQDEGMRLDVYRTVFRTPQVARLVPAGMIGRAPVGMTSLGLVLLVRHLGESYATAGLVVAAYAVSTGVTAPLVGRLIDRIGQTRVLLVCGSGCLGAFGALAAAAQFGWRGLLAPLAALAGVLIPPLAPCMRALWSTLLGRGPALQAAFSLEAAGQELNFIVGPLLVVALATAASPAVAMLVIGLLAFGGTLWFATSPASRAWRGGVRDRTAHWAGALRGRGVRTLVAAAMAFAVGIGAVEVAVPAVSEHFGSRALAGPFLAVWSAGSMLGGVVAGARRPSAAPERRLWLLLGLIAAGFVPLTFAHQPVLFGAAMTLAGLGIAPGIACLYLLIDRTAPTGTLTEAFTWVTCAFTAGIATGSAVGGALVQHAGPAAAFLVGTATAAVAALIVRTRRASLGTAEARAEDQITTSATARSPAG
jgi:MFS family permease